MDEQQGIAEVNGTGLYYETAGSGHPLVLIHGFTLDTRLRDDQFEPSPNIIGSCATNCGDTASRYHPRMRVALIPTTSKRYSNT
jgi:hypothetical protein